jgi:site-specific DNA-cytosine methylase
MKTATVLFCGIGLMDLALWACGYKVVQAVECDRKIASCYAHNFPEVQLFTEYVQKVDSRTFVPTELVHGSPSCKNATSVNQNGESMEDIQCAQAFLAIIQQMHLASNELLPRFVTVENVENYFRGFRSFRILRSGLEKLGYYCHIQTLEASEMGVPQRRKRCWARFSKEPLTDIQYLRSRVGWGYAIAHHIPNLPTTQFADWQVNRLIKKYGATSTEHLYQTLSNSAYLIEKVGAANGGIQVIPPQEPVFTLKSMCDRHTQQMVLWLPSGVVKKISPAALWDLQMLGCKFPYQFPPKTSEYIKVVGIGNGIPYNMGKAVIASFCDR